MGFLPPQWTHLHAASFLEWPEQSMPIAASQEPLTFRITLFPLVL